MAVNLTLNPRLLERAVAVRGERTTTDVVARALEVLRLDPRLRRGGVIATTGIVLREPPRGSGDRPPRSATTPVAAAPISARS